MAQAARSYPLSAERVYDSGDEDEAQGVAGHDALPSNSKTSNGIKDDHGDDDSSEVEASDSEDEETAEDEDESEDDQSESEIGSAVTSASSQKTRSSPTPELEETAAKSVQSRAAIPAKPFKAPKGYEPIARSQSDTSSTVRQFHDLSEKEVWLIAAPGDVPIDSIKELAVDAVMRGQPIITHNGIAYGMQPLPSKNETVLLPQGVDASYQQAEKKIGRSFIMREVNDQTKVPSQEGTPQAFTATRPGKPKEIRQQPEGLKKRYTPPGVPAGTAAQSGRDVEMDDAPEPTPAVRPKKGTNGKEPNDNSSGKRKRG
ncbi:hypothetical protein G647_04419 [Cladophialophora carrionii CBS 160.54]|uniref:Uncharacterized protein n=1 Tax=Cladophialophora carrionii CBS 160.54 TaxID=1279043 RepID=V9DDR8_9EURO|nr:uncharacterized protein G647_04419 [Cladophialophora carrionii CBS 160.54]ETI25049.1 hypothetical protein G647_04419 [Cladophialophora carrionii CBS 160.54]